jgi:hypothetical protein
LAAEVFALGGKDFGSCAGLLTARCKFGAKLWELCGDPAIWRRGRLPKGTKLLAVGELSPWAARPFGTGSGISR